MNKKQLVVMWIGIIVMLAYVAIEYYPLYIVPEKTVPVENYYYLYKNKPFMSALDYLHAKQDADIDLNILKEKAQKRTLLIGFITIFACVVLFFIFQISPSFAGVSFWKKTFSVFKWLALLALFFWSFTWVSSTYLPFSILLGAFIFFLVYKYEKAKLHYRLKRQYYEDQIEEIISKHTKP